MGGRISWTLKGCPQKFDTFTMSRIKLTNIAREQQVAAEEAELNAAKVVKE